MDDGGVILLVIIVVALYLTPTIIGLVRGSPYTGVIFALNLFGGWTVVCWLAAFVWSLWPKGHSAAAIDVNLRHSGNVDLGFGGEPIYQHMTPPISLPSPQRSTLDELERLAHLRTIGAISQEEFQAEKTHLLGR